MGYFGVEGNKRFNIKDVVFGVNDALGLTGQSKFREGLYDGKGTQIADVIYGYNGAPEVVVFSITATDHGRFEINFQSEIMLSGGIRVGERIEQIGLDGITKLIQKRAEQRSFKAKTSNLLKGGLRLWHRFPNPFRH